MDISELGALGEFVSSIAVLITLIFLVLQMRQNARLMRRDNARKAHDTNSQALAGLLDAGVSELFIKGLNSLDSLSEVERYRFDNAFANWMLGCEQAFLDQREGDLVKGQFTTYKNAVPGYLITPGGRQWWVERKVWFSEDFRNEVDELCAKLSSEAKTSGPKISSNSNHRED